MKRASILNIMASPKPIKSSYELSELYALKYNSLTNDCLRAIDEHFWFNDTTSEFKVLNRDNIQLNEQLNSITSKFSHVDNYTSKGYIQDSEDSQSTDSLWFFYDY